MTTEDVKVQHMRGCRLVTEDDIESATRGCNIRTRKTDSLLADLKLHASLPMFASGVIETAIRRELAARKVQGHEVAAQKRQAEGV